VEKETQMIEDGKTWKYMDELDYRYEEAAKFIRPEERVVDLNAGNSRLRKYCLDYVSNDLYNKAADYQMTDEEFVKGVKKMDVLCCFGLGGNEIDHHILESSTITQSIIDAAKRYTPRKIILDCVKKYSSIAERIIKDTGYYLYYSLDTDSKDWKKDRRLYVLRRMKNVHETYVELANMVRKGKTLKLDAWQEANNFFPIKADNYLEILPNLCEKAKEKGYNAKKGDIRDMPYEDKEFDTLIDTSTIDHILDYEVALKEYNRVLKDKGNILLITWITERATHEGSKDSVGGRQFYFNKMEFTKKLNKYFIIEESKSILEKGGEKVYYFIGKKK